jgi:catechol 2,3-dioxygenase
MSVRHTTSRAPEHVGVEPVRFRPRRLGHANLFVGDVERSARFYHEICGLELVRREPAITAAFLSNGNTHHDVGLIQVSPEARRGRDGFVQPSGTRGKRPGLNHLGFEMESEAELVAAHGRAVAAGVKIHSTADHIISRSVYLFDPSGNLLEFYADALADWRTVFNPDQEDLVTGAWTPGATPPVDDRNYPVNPDIRRVPNAIVPSRKIAYAALAVPELVESLRFYEGVAGLDLIARDGDRIAALRGTASAFDLLLFQTMGGQHPGLHHIAFEVDGAETIAAAKGRLLGAGVRVEAEVDAPAKRSLLVQDPDDILVEFAFRRVIPAGSALPEDVMAV